MTFHTIIPIVYHKFRFIPCKTVYQHPHSAPIGIISLCFIYVFVEKKRIKLIYCYSELHLLLLGVFRKGIARAFHQGSYFNSISQINILVVLFLYCCMFGKKSLLSGLFCVQIADNCCCCWKWKDRNAIKRSSFFATNCHLFWFWRPIQMWFKRAASHPPHHNC